MKFRHFLYFAYPHLVQVDMPVRHYKTPFSFTASSTLQPPNFCLQQAGCAIAFSMWNFFFANGVFAVRRDIPPTTQGVNSRGLIAG
jgi:hypothetical protein